LRKDITSIPLHLEIAIAKIIFVSRIQFTESVTILLKSSVLFKYINNLIKAIITLLEHCLGFNHFLVLGEPGNFTHKALKKGIIDLEWHHPWRTGRPLDHFYIAIYQLSTNLIRLCGENVPNQNLFINVTNYKRQYTKRLYLCPSTRYNISIKAVTVTGQSSKVIHDEFETPSSLEFNGALEYAVHDSMISLHIPSVVNVTKNSIMHVIVKGSLGPEGCQGYLRVPENLQALAGLDASHVAWEAAEILVGMI